MANLVHLAELLKRAPAWNQWRRTSLLVNPNLRQADLKRANLTQSDLREADLSRANVTGANSLGRTSAKRASAGRTSASVTAELGMFQVGALPSRSNWAAVGSLTTDQSASPSEFCLIGPWHWRRGFFVENDRRIAG
jgi:hypothetical protein